MLGGMGMDADEWFELLIQRAEVEMALAPLVSVAHGVDHLQRVWDRSKMLSTKLGGDLETLAAAVALHDLGRHYGLEVHGEKSALLAEPLLLEEDFPKSKIPQVLESIILHDTNINNSKRKTTESRILYDADKLDSFGVIGVVRHIVFYYERGTEVEQILDSIENRWNGLHFDETREIAKADYVYLVSFFKKLLAVEGVEKGSISSE